MSRALFQVSPEPPVQSSIIYGITKQHFHYFSEAHELTLYSHVPKVNLYIAQCARGVCALQSSSIIEVSDLWYQLGELLTMYLDVISTAKK